MKKICFLGIIVCLLASNVSIAQVSPFCGNPSITIPPDTVDELDLLTAKDSIGFGIYNNAMQWTLKYRLFSKLYYNNDLLSLDASLSDFYNAMEESPIAQLTLTEDAIDYILTMDTADVSLLDGYKEQIREYLDSMGVLTALYVAETDSATQAGIFADMAALQADIAALDSTADTLWAQYEDYRQAVIDFAIEVNGSISAETEMEANLQAVNEIYLNAVLRGGELDSAQAALLYNIAVQCPMGGGAGVYKARALYGLVDRNVLFSDSVCSDTVDVCPPPARPVIAGISSGICGTMTLTYAVTPVEGAVSYSWFLSDTMAVFDGESTGDSVRVIFAEPFDSLMLFVVANGICGNSEPDTLMLYSAPKFPVYTDNRIDVCCSDTLWFTFPDSMAITLWAEYQGYLVSGEGVNAILAEAEATAEGEGIYSPIYSQTHEVIYDCENDVYMEVDIVCSINPTFIRVVVCGNIEEDTLMLAALNECGWDSVLYILNDTCYAGDSCSSEERLAAPLSSAKGNGSVEVYPNPTDGSLTVKFSDARSNRYAITLTDITGRILMTKEGDAKEGINYEELNISSLVKGMYFLNVRTESMNKLVRISKQ